MEVIKLNDWKSADGLLMTHWQQAKDYVHAMKFKVDSCTIKSEFIILTDVPCPKYYIGQRCKDVTGYFLHEAQQLMV